MVETIIKDSTVNNLENNTTTSISYNTKIESSVGSNKKQVDSSYGCTIPVRRQTSANSVVQIDDIESMINDYKKVCNKRLFKENINKAKSLNISPTIDIFKQEAIILIRLKKYDEAKMALNKYLDSIKIFREKVWALKMINKINKMKKLE